MTYVVQSEVVELLSGWQKEFIREHKDDAADAMASLLKEVERMNTYKPNVQARWKTDFKNKQVIFCSSCGLVRKAYQNTRFCPNCGKSMINGAME